MPKIIIGFVGEIASGKDVSKKYLEEHYGASSHRYSTVLRDILNRLYIPVNRQNLQNLSLDLRTRFGSDLLARVIIEDIGRDQHDIVIIDGIRRLDDINSLNGKFPALYVIALAARPEIRYERAVRRNENIGDADKTFDQFVTEGQAEAEREIPLVMSRAHHTIDNNGDFAALYAQIDRIVTEIKNQSEQK